MQLLESNTQIWKMFAGIAIYATASAIYALAGAAGVLPAWHTAWAHYVHAILLCGLLAVLGAGYAWLRRCLKQDAEAQRIIVANSACDSLTGALNRAAFLSYIRHALRTRGTEQLGYLHIDMDNLKVLNDSFGHKVGDAALAHLVSSIRSIAPSAPVGRLGGDEFAVLLTGTKSKEESRDIAQMIVDKLGMMIVIDGQNFNLSASIGIAQAPLDGDGVEQLIANADLALYAGKVSGRRKVVAFEADMMIDEQHKRFIERELRGAILTGEIDVHYQPIVVAETGQVRSYEALVRWNHSTRGMIGPNLFIPIAERGTLIDLLGDWVLARVCRDLAVLGTPTVSVNISPAQLRRPDFAGRFLEILSRTGVAPSRLIAEITETSRFRANMAEMQNIRELKDAGVLISIDDFGAGHTSLQYLRYVPFDYIKIDKGYVQNLESDAVNQALISAICGIGRALNAKIVAEGIETEMQSTLLRAAGCTHMQGYFFGYPTSINHLAEARKLVKAA